jgi:hypothetical protein
MTDPPTVEQPWLGLTEAARVTGLSREAIRSRARRGLVPSRKNNRGELLVQLLPGSMTEADHGVTDAMADLLAEVTDLRERLARAETARDAAVTIGEARVAAVREIADRLTHELAEVRRPWWRRIVG